MTLEVEPPEPPELEFVDPNEYEDATVSADGDEEIDYRREELQGVSRGGAWTEAFDEWRADTDLEEREYGIARDLDLFAGFDFFWDDFADRVGYHAPGIPEDWQAREYHPDLDTWGRCRRSTPNSPSSARSFRSSSRRSTSTGRPSTSRPRSARLRLSLQWRPRAKDERSGTDARTNRASPTARRRN